MKRVIEIFPLLSAVLILVGFYNLFIYYKFFDIEIYNYLTTSELIISFLPVIVSTIFIVFALLTFLSILLFNGSSDDETDFSIKESVKTLFAKDQYKGNAIKIIAMFLFNFLSVIHKLLGIGMIGFLIILYCWILYKKEKVIFENYSIVVFLTVIFCAALVVPFIDFLIKRVEKMRKVDLSSYLLVINFFLYFLIFNSLSNYKDALKVLSGKSQTEITFLYEKELISSSKDFCYVGQTQEWVIMRKLSDSTNYFYRKGIIGQLQLKSK